MHASSLILTAALLATTAGGAKKPAPSPGGAPAAAPPAAPAASEPRDWNAPPPGSSAEDAALWTRLRTAIEDATLAVSRMNKCGLRLRGGAYYEKLETLGKEQGSRADQARALRQRLEAVARATDATVPKPLRTQVCKYTLLHFEQRVDARDDPTLRSELPQFRKEATGCADELAGLAARLDPRVTELEGAIAEADALLGRPAPDASAGLSSQGDPPPSLLPSSTEKP